MVFIFWPDYCIKLDMIKNPQYAMTANVTILCLSLFFSPVVLAKNFHNMKNVKQQVADYLYNLPDIKQYKDTKVSVHSVDRRLKLAKCDSLNFKLATGSHLMGKTSVRVICSSPKPWSFYITATISRFDEVMVLNGSFSRGHIIKASDVFQVRKDLSKLPFGYITNKSDVIGKQLKRHCQAGRILTPSYLTNPIVIKRGELVALQKKAAGFMVSMKGTAMMDGAIGDNIRVKNNSSKRIIEGKITQSGIVIINN